MPYADPEKHRESRRAYAREYAKRYAATHPGHVQAKSKHRYAAEKILRERYAREYRKILTELGYEGVTGKAKYLTAVKILKDRHPRAWANARDEARANG